MRMRTGDSDHVDPTECSLGPSHFVVVNADVKLLLHTEESESAGVFRGHKASARPISLLYLIGNKFLLLCQSYRSWSSWCVHVPLRPCKSIARKVVEFVPKIQAPELSHFAQVTTQNKLSATYCVFDRPCIENAYHADGKIHGFELAGHFEGDMRSFAVSSEEIWALGIKLAHGLDILLRLCLIFGLIVDPGTTILFH